MPSFSAKSRKLIFGFGFGQKIPNLNTTTEGKVSLDFRGNIILSWSALRFQNQINLGKT